MDADAKILEFLLPKAKRHSVPNLNDTGPNERTHLKSSAQKSDEETEVQEVEEQMLVRKSQTQCEEKEEEEKKKNEPEEKEQEEEEKEQEEKGGKKLVEECKSRGQKEQSPGGCSECGGADSSTTGSRKSKGSCLGCFLQSVKERSLRRLPFLSEAFMGSFMASLLWLQNGKESSVTSSKSSSPIESVEEKKKKKKRKKAGENLSLRKSAVRMISDICEIINGTAREIKEQSERTTEDTDLDSSSRPSLASGSARPSSSPRSKSVEVEAPADEVSCLYRGQKAFPKEAPKERTGRGTLRTAEEPSKEEESDFEEALSFPFAPSEHFDLKAKPSVTCMGDLSKSLASSVPSWTEKLSKEIISKLRKGKSKTSVRVFQQPYEQPKGWKAASGRLEFTFSANTALGVFDVTVVQYKKSQNLRDRLMQLRAMPLHTSCASTPIYDRQVSGGMMSVKEDVSSWSEDSLRNVDSDVVSNSGESDFEEFIEVFLEDATGDKKRAKPTRGSHGKGNLRALELKTYKPHFFEIQKCYAVNYAQEILQKGASGPQKVEKYKNQMEEQKILSLNSGEKKQKQVVIEGSTSDLVIYIQVEVDDGSASKSDGIYLEYQKSSLGTQTAEESKRDLEGEGTIKLEEEKHDGATLYQIWKGCDATSSTDLKTMLPVEKLKEDELAADEDEEVLAVEEPKEKTVTFNEELSEILIETEVQETTPEEVAVTADARGLDLREVKQHADVWLVQQNVQRVQRAETRRSERPPPIPAAIPPAIPATMPATVPAAIPATIPAAIPGGSTPVVDAPPQELQKALRLIREIESDVVDVKVSDAISILPRLETELRKHLQNKMKGLGEKELGRESSMHSFFSAISFWPQQAAENESETSEDRLNNLLGMLADLEEAVKSSEYSANNIDLCQCDSSKIYKLLQALTASIRELEGRPDMTSLSQTLEIASQLDTAVREYDCIVKKQPVDYMSSERGARRNWKKQSSAAEMSVMQHLRNVRQKVFGMVEEEAIAVEGRIERDFDRLDRLEGENDEALMFLETFLQKTERRVVELADLKSALKDLSSSLNNMYEELRGKLAERREKEMEVVQIKCPEEQNILTDSSFDSLGVPAPPDKSEPLRETISGLLIALDALKSRAKEKKEFCREILSLKGTPDGGGSRPKQEPGNSSQRSSRSSFTTKHGDKLHATVREFKKIGHSSLYLAWTKPEGPLEGSIVGYQIYVNEKLNQKVRNPQRVQAVLYSVDLSGKAQIQLYALTESGPKILLATVDYQDE